MKQIILTVLVIIGLILVGISIAATSKYVAKEFPLECKVKELYFNPPGYKVEAKYVLVLEVVDYKVLTDIEVTPTTFYKATKNMKQNRSMTFKFGRDEIDHFQNREKPFLVKYFKAFLIYLGLVLLIVIIAIFPSN